MTKTATPPMEERVLRLGRIEGYILLGGGVILSECAPKLQADGYRVRVVTSRRHLQEAITATGHTLAQTLAAAGIEPLVCDEVGDGRAFLGDTTEGVLGLSFGAAWIFRKPLIDRFDGRLLNVHGTRLPLDRGGGGFSWQILRDNRLGGCLIHQVDEGVDTGPIVKHREFVYPPSCRIPRDYHEVCLRQMRGLMADFFQDVRTEAPFTLLEQPAHAGTYWPRLSTEHQGYLDWSWSLRAIERFIYAFDEPYRGASTFLRGKRVFLKDCLINTSDGTFHPFQRGLIYRISGDGVCVATDDGRLVVRTVQDDEGANITARLRVGDRFHTPIAILEQARAFRAVYTPAGLHP